MTTNHEVPQDESYPEADEMTDTDFNLDDEYKPIPLAPLGSYKGVIKAVTYESKNAAIAWTIVASGNDGFTMLDGDNAIDGTEYTFRNWLPRTGDENIGSKDGKSNKRQNKINMLKQFQDEMEIDMNTQQKVHDAITNSDWIGIPVIFKVGIQEYPKGSGRNSNTVDRMVRTDEDIDMPDGM